MARRLAPILAAALVAAVAAMPAAASPHPRGALAAWTSMARVSRCSTVLDEAVFQGRMRKLPGTHRMAMRFTLLQRTGLGPGYAPVAAPGLGKWRKSRVGVGAFGYKQAVRNLADGALYRVRVDFRWLDGDGKVLAKAQRKSSTCPERDALPNLRVKFVGVYHTPAAASDRYAIRVTNFGDASAQGVLTRLSVDGEVAASGTFGALAAKSSVKITLRGPECKDFVQAQVDPDSLIAESVETDNSQLRACSALRSL
jgi:hypothetical protein